MDSDIEILQNIKKDKQQFVTIYKKYFPTIYKYVYFKVNFNKEAAQDIVSDVFLKALTSINSVKLGGKHSTLLPWLYVIARNEVVKSYKTKTGVSLDVDVLEGIKGVSDNIDNEIEAQKVLELIDDTNLIAKDILYMKIYNQYSFKEIAVILKMKESAVKMQYYRSIESVTKLLNK